MSLLMIIVCPNCDARYELANAALGNAGRKVQCANCKTDWNAKAEPDSDDQMFDPEQERELDAAFEREQSKGKGYTAKEDDDPDIMDPKKLAIHRSNLARRQQKLTRNLPRARLRRIGRMAAVITLMTLIGGGLFSRDLIVSAVPELSWIYGALGMSINVVGLEFRDVETVRTTIDGVEVIEITGNIENIAGRQVSVPPILVRLFDDQNVSIYEWSVQPQARVLTSGEWIEFSTRLTAPPSSATDLRLGFATDNNVSGGISATANPAD